MENEDEKHGLGKITSLSKKHRMPINITVDDKGKQSQAMVFLGYSLQQQEAIILC